MFYAHTPFLILRRKSQTFQDHAQVVVGLICQHRHISSRSTASTCGILEYVIASSYRGMRRQINSKHSVAFREALFSIKNFQVTYQPKHPRHIGNVRAFLRVLPSIASKCNIQIPRLLRVSARSADLNLSLHDVYNKETCTEFHQTLCALLRGFQDSLEKLAGCLSHNIAVQPPKELKSQPFVAEVPSSQEVLESLVGEIRFYGSCLHTIAYGLVIHMHLSTIANLLEQYALNNHVDSWSEEENIADNLSSDFGLFAPPHTSNRMRKPLFFAKACLIRLRLMVQYFEAVDVALKAFRNRPRKPLNFSIKIMTIPSQGQSLEMTPWKDLVVRIFFRDTASAQDAIQMIDELRAKYEHFESAFGNEASLSTGHGFLGGLHCVACMASIISLAPSATIDLVSHALFLLCIRS